MEKEQQILLSVIIPVYNAEKFLGECIESIYSQQLRQDEFEVIAVNDGSTDGTPGMLRRFAAKYGNMAVIDVPNGGPSAARNEGLRHARGTYLLFVDSDDYLLPQKLAPLLSEAIRNDLDILRADYLPCDEAGHISGGVLRYARRTRMAGTVTDGETLYSDIFCGEFYCWLLLLRRSFVLSEGLLFDEGICLCEDVDYCVRASVRARRVMYSPCELYAYRQRNGSITNAINQKMIADLQTVTGRINSYSRDASLGKRMRNELRRHYAHLCMFMLVRLSEPALYPYRRRLMQTSGIRRIPPCGSLKSVVVAILYNLFGTRSIDLLHPVMLLKLKFLGGRRCKE